MRIGGGRWRASPGSYSRVSPKPEHSSERVAPKELTAGALAVTPAVWRAFSAASNKFPPAVVAACS